ncbi:WD40-repeat-containing domain protein [Schizophyllum amplum]|uniref:WD40-repeat-containing domain protein n=1 Tax=Schizophyllum amplum TaxID=97359 RepID=A0A550C750_9AGAR|nr:WD40-repeat-containing domain protein [Auriculariopsis ampla]
MSGPKSVPWSTFNNDLHVMAQKRMEKLVPAHRQDDSLLRNGFPYHKRLKAHDSCVNALAFSASDDGRFLASGGDDLKVQIWDLHRQDQSAPNCTLRGAISNIFNIAFSATNKYIFSGGADEMVMQYDFTTASTLLSAMRTRPSMYANGQYDNNASIRDISCHPYNDEIFISASEDGRIVMYDARTANTQGEIQLLAEATGARFNPVLEHIFATSDKQRLQLRDARMAFGSRSSLSDGGVVRTYSTRLTRTTAGERQRCSPEVNSFTFDAAGQNIAATTLHHYPVIYALSDPAPVAVCTSGDLPAEEGSYSNSCTMKHGSFSGRALNGNYYAAGSDDFRGYVWRLPSLAELLERRTEVPRNEAIPADAVAYIGPDTDSPYIPATLTRPTCQLTGHNSIVNSTIFHPTLPHIFTAGIERDVLIHGPTPGSPCVAGLRRSPPSAAVRRVDGSQRRLRCRINSTG